MDQDEQRLYDQRGTNLANCWAECDRWKATAKELAEALKVYGQHKFWCGDRFGRCTCGLDACLIELHN